MIRTLLASSFCVAALVAQTPSWFPLDIGNTWLYRPAATNRGNQDYRSITVHGKETISGREYFDVTYFGREVLLRIEPADGTMVSYNRESGSEQPWLALDSPVGASFPTTIDPCSNTGTIESRDASVNTPAGIFAPAVGVRFQGGCADAGLTRQFYAENVGLVASEETSFAGPVTFELVYFQTGSGAGSAPEVAFTVAIDAPAHTAGSTLNARLTLRSTGPDPIQLTFPSSQSFDLKIIDEQGNAVFMWSAARSFAMIVREETFGPGEKTYGVTAPLGDLAPGRYRVEAWLTTAPIMYSGVVSFEIVQKTGTE